MVKLTYEVTYKDKGIENTMDFVVSAKTFKESLGKAKKLAKELAEGYELVSCKTRRVEYVNDNTFMGFK